jgi:hypothetical protein
MSALSATLSASSAVGFKRCDVAFKCCGVAFKRKQALLDGSTRGESDAQGEGGKLYCLISSQQTR